MANEKQVYMPQQAQEEQQIDVKQLVYTFLNYWYLFAIFVLVALAICFVINRYSTKVYQTAGTIIVKDARSEYDPTTIMTNMSFGNYQIVDNEVAILKSYSLSDRAVRKMNLEVTYLEKGRIGSTELYHNAPFTVEFDHSVAQAVGLVYEITELSDGNIVLHGTSDYVTKFDYILSQTLDYVPEKVDFICQCKPGEWFDNGYNRLRIVLNDFYDPQTDPERKFSFWLNSYPSLVNQMQSFTVDPISKQSSVISIVMKGTNKQKIVEFTNTLMNEYMTRGLEKKNLVCNDTMEFYL
mgnify:FL=1